MAFGFEISNSKLSFSLTMIGFLGAIVLIARTDGMEDAYGEELKRRYQ